MFRSQSGPGGLSINTAAANASSNQTSNPPPSGSTVSKPLFGNASTSTQPQNTSLFGNPQSQAPSNQPQGSGLFGSQQNTTQTAGGGLFGSQPNQHRPSNFFGGANVQQPQSQTGGGLFGSTLGQSTTQQANNNPFGNSVFGQGNTLLMGNTQNTVQNPQPSFQPAPPSLFSITIGQQAQSQQVVPGVRVTINELRPTTRFGDLHEELQKVIEYVDTFILNKIQWQEACDAGNNSIDAMMQQVPPDVELCAKQHGMLQNAQENDAESIASSKSLVKNDAAHAKLSFKAIQSLKLPQQFQQSSIWASTAIAQVSTHQLADTEAEEGGSHNIVEYFSKQTDTMSDTLNDCKRNLSEIEQYLKVTESNIIQQTRQTLAGNLKDDLNNSAEDQVRELAAVLRTFENGILGVAARVGAARETVQDAMLAPDQ